MQSKGGNETHTITIMMPTEKERWERKKRKKTCIQHQTGKMELTVFARLQQRCCWSEGEKTSPSCTLWILICSPNKQTWKIHFPRLAAGTGNMNMHHQSSSMFVLCLDGGFLGIDMVENKRNSMLINARKNSFVRCLVGENQQNFTKEFAIY